MGEGEENVYPLKTMLAFLEKLHRSSGCSAAPTYQAEEEPGRVEGYQLKACKPQASKPPPCPKPL